MILSNLFDIFFHKFLVELRAQRVIDKAFLLSCIVHSFGTILEHDVIIPSKITEQKLKMFINGHWKKGEQSFSHIVLE